MAGIQQEGSYTRSQYLRLKVRRGPKKAVVAVAASILTAAYFILLRGVPYADLGPSFNEEQWAEMPSGVSTKCRFTRFIGDAQNPLVTAQVLQTQIDLVGPAQIRRLQDLRGR